MRTKIIKNKVGTDEFSPYLYYIKYKHMKTAKLISKNYNLSGHSTSNETFNFNFEVGSKYSVQHVNDAFPWEGTYKGFINEDRYYGDVIILLFDRTSGDEYGIDADFHRDNIFIKIS